MIHTAELITKIDYENYYNLLQQEKRKIDNNKNIYLHNLNNVGITRIHAFTQKIENGYIYWCEIIVNLNRVCNNGKPTPMPFVVNRLNIEKLKINFCKFIKQLLPNRANILAWSVQRIDYTLDIKTPYVKEYIQLLQRGDKPRQCYIDNNTQHKSEMEKTHYKGSVRYKNKSVTLNIYDKYKERQKENYSGTLLQECKDILRIEIQCFKNKAIRIKRKFNRNSYGFKAYLLSEEEQKSIFKYYLSCICGKNTYFEYIRAVKKVEDSNFRATTKQTLILLLKSVSEHKSVWKTKVYIGKEKYYNILSKLQKIDINPVTIPRRWNIKQLKNIYHLIE